MTNLARVFGSLTSHHWSWTFLTDDGLPSSISELVTLKLPHIDPSTLPKRFAWGGFYLNGKFTQHDLPLKAPCRVEYYEPKYEIDKADELFPKLRPAHIFYRDHDLMAVFKPAGLPSYESKDQSRYYFKAMLLEQVGLPLHLPSRLDTSVSGLVIASTSEEMHKYLQQAFEKRSVEKVYRLRVIGTVPWLQKTINKPIGRDPVHPILRRVVTTGGKTATTEFTNLGSQPYKLTDGTEYITTLLEARPKTGRTHQIRVHAANLGYPIIGDHFYNGALASDLHLVSYQFKFFHPILKEKLEIKLPWYLTPTWANNRSS